MGGILTATVQYNRGDILLTLTDQLAKGCLLTAGIQQEWTLTDREQHWQGMLTAAGSLEQRVEVER